VRQALLLVATHRGASARLGLTLASGRRCLRAVSGKQRILVLGSGARESALAMALARSPSVAEVLIAPGNAGTSRAARDGAAPILRQPIAALTAEAAVETAKLLDASLVVVGPEAPLVAGVADALSAAGIPVFGPSRAAAALEASKAFLKRFAARHGIPTAAFDVVTDVAAADAAIARRPGGAVVKADGLCAGKGVVVASSADQARAAARSMLDGSAFGDAGRTVIIEDLLPGVEASVHAISDGRELLVLPAARDHKRVGEGDTGPNTGGMGAFAPAPLPPALLERVEREILRPTIDGMRAEGTPFAGVLFAGLMIAPDGTPMLLEHNVRFGDPECEVLMALLDGDVAALLGSVASGRLDRGAVSVAAGRVAVAVVLASAGYPEAPRSGDAIHGLDAAADRSGVVVHHAGTATHDGEVVTAGGRVLTVTAVGADLAEARSRAYQAAADISFAGKHFRRDIGTAGARRP
jgi:phosphoribosylamine---glycine ligase